ncbi:MAG: hypothetical protein H6708_13570 [Kofleriaceae bacterium]|nr:hypothetical protein [Kofleriaceae bacterium]
MPPPPPPRPPDLDGGDDTVTTVAAGPAPAVAPPRQLDTITPLPPPPVVARATPTPSPPREPTMPDPPPTRIARPDALAERPFTPPKVIPIPEVPEPGLINAVRYAVTFLRARWQRRGAIKGLADEIKQDTAALDLVLGTLGKQARDLKVDNRALSAENAAIDAAEQRKHQLDEANAELNGRRVDETAKFAEVEHEKLIKVSEAERILDEASRELSIAEGQRRSLRDKRKEVERRQKAYLKAAEERDHEAGGSAMGEARGELRRAAEGHRREAAALEPERQDLDRRIAALDRPIATAQAKTDAARAELESARRSLNDAREGHRHRLAEIEAEQGRKMRELALADAEIQRRLVTLGTLVNLNRIEDPGFGDLYERIDRLRMAIGARTTEIDKLTAEREAYDKGSLVRGFVALGGGVVVVITLVVILLALL